MTIPDGAENFARLCIDVAGGFLAVGSVFALAVVIVVCVACLLLALLSAVFDGR